MRSSVPPRGSRWVFTPEAFQIVAGGPQTTGSFVLLNPHAEGVPDVWHPSGVQTIIDVIRWSPLRSDHRLLSETPPAWRPTATAR